MQKIVTHIAWLLKISMLFIAFFAVSCSAPRTNKQKSMMWNKQKRRSVYRSQRSARRMQKGKGFWTPSEKDLKKSNKKSKHNSKKFRKSKYKLKRRKGKGL